MLPVWNAVFQVTPRNTTVQRITQVVHPVGRGRKKALLAHIINEHDWSQVLVFTRTKFGASNVAEFLTKNGIEAMALHGNKSQSARTQALSGFKSGSIRALVATDMFSSAVAGVSPEMGGFSALDRPIGRVACSVH